MPIRWVLIRDPQQRFDTQALLSTDQQAPTTQIVQWFVHRWQVEVTFEEVRAHLGMETQRQWSDKAIARTTPLLLALFSLVTLFAPPVKPFPGDTSALQCVVSKSTPQLQRCVSACATPALGSRGF